MKNEYPDKKALKILLSDDFIQKKLSIEDIQYCKEKGLMFDPINKTHDEIIEWIFKEKEKCQKIHYTNLFIASLSTNRMDLRSGLSVYAIVQTFPKHTFVLRENQQLSNVSPCKICSYYPKAINVDLSNSNLYRFLIGGLLTHQIYDYAFYLEQHNILSDIEPSDEDFRIFSDILEVIIDSDEKETPITLQKKIQKIKIFKSNADQRKGLLETLGYCSILETDKYKGLLKQYINLAVAPRKTHGSDWNYPMDWWNGKDGINKEALKFWFGNYPELKKFC